jgi:hypothetical protein
MNAHTHICGPSEPGPLSLAQRPGDRRDLFALRSPARADEVIE